MEWKIGVDGRLGWYYDGEFIWGTDARSKRPLGGQSALLAVSRARLLRLLGVRPAALGGFTVRVGQAGPLLRAYALPWLLEPAASRAADSAASNPNPNPNQAWTRRLSASMRSVPTSRA